MAKDLEIQQLEVTCQWYEEHQEEEAEENWDDHWTDELDGADDASAQDPNQQDWADVTFQQNMATALDEEPLSWDAKTTDQFNLESDWAFQQGYGSTNDNPKSPKLPTVVGAPGDGLQQQPQSKQVPPPLVPTLNLSNLTGTYEDRPKEAETCTLNSIPAAAYKFRNWKSYISANGFFRSQGPRLHPSMAGTNQESDGH